MEKIKPGSASQGTLRVPKDQVAATQRQALDKVTGRRRIRVKGMDFTSEQAGKQLDKGLGDLAKSGVEAGSQARALAKGGAVGAAIGVGIGAVTRFARYIAAGSTGASSPRTAASTPSRVRPTASSARWRPVRAAQPRPRALERPRARVSLRRPAPPAPQSSVPSAAWAPGAQPLPESSAV